MPAPRAAVLAVTACVLGCSPAQPLPDAGPSCTEPSGAPLKHQFTIAADETWAATSVHTVTADLTIAAGATVTLEPCAQVVISPGVFWYVDGKVIARGDAQRPITIKADTGPFAAIFVRAPGSIDLAYVTLSGGGSNTGIAWGSELLVEGAWPIVRPIAVDHVTVKDAAGYGIVLRKYAAFSDASTDLTITNCGRGSATWQHPIKMSLNTLGSLPSGSYTGNQVDEISVIGESPHYSTEVDDVIHDRGVPYHIGTNGGSAGELRVGVPGSVPTLTIEPGVTIRLESPTKMGRVYVGIGSSTGQLVAVGTAEKPITFTVASPTPAPGAWVGVDFADPVAAGDRMEFTVIEYAGAPGGASGFGCLPMSLNRDDAALRVFGQPAAAFFKSSTIRHSAGHAILSAWTGPQLDFKTSNTFEDIATGGCDQVIPKPPVPASCPAMPACQ